MLASSFLDTAIGIIFVFLLLSVIASTVNEIILSTISLRGRFLLRGLKTLLDDPSATGLVKEVYNHGQIFGLYRGTFDPSKPRNLPSYIPANNFVMAFLGILPEAPIAIAASEEALADRRASAAKAAASKAPQDAAAAREAAEWETRASAAVASRHKAEQIAKNAKTAFENVITNIKAGVGLPAATAAAEEAARKAADALNSAREAKAAAEANPADQAAADRAVALANLGAAATDAKAAAEKILADQASGVQISVALQSLKGVAIELANNPASAKVGKPLVEMMNQAGDDVEKLKASLEAWYNSAMDRVSGWYRYHTQWILFWIGLSLAMALNANTVVIVKQLSRDATLRQSIVAAAQSEKTQPSIGNTIEDVKNQVEKVEQLGIPLGWKNPLPTSWHQFAAWIALYPAFIKALPGLILTAVAVSLGAPFWFDLLNKIMVVRSTIKPHEKSVDEGTKDKPAKR